MRVVTALRSSLQKCSFESLVVSAAAAHLNQEAGLGAVLLLQLLGEVVEHANEAGANGLALLLRVHHPLQWKRLQIRMLVGELGELVILCAWMVSIKSLVIIILSTRFDHPAVQWSRV